MTGRLKARTINVLGTRVAAKSATASFDQNLEVRPRQGDANTTAMLERLWAYVTIRRLLESSKKTHNATVIGTAKTRALDLSLRVGIDLVYYSLKN